MRLIKLKYNVLLGCIGSPLQRRGKNAERSPEEFVVEIINRDN